jgi:ADP-heptose:LPS heptosyltransferase
VASLIRELSLLKRRWKDRRDASRVIERFDEARLHIASLPKPEPTPRRLLLIRLDDIGDYLLFRNQLGMYSASRWAGHAITLLGNLSWRPLFEAYDLNTVRQVIWVNKSQYLDSSTYRAELWMRLREGGFDTVIAPSRTRPLLLDDACMLAAAPRHAIGAHNDHVHPSWSRVSDALYQEHIEPSRERLHEFHFNAEFAQRCGGASFGGMRPMIEAVAPQSAALPYDAGAPPPAAPHMVCFIGANTRSKRWPPHRWIEFIKLYAGHYSHRVLLAGQSQREIGMAESIERATGAQSMAGRLDLPALARLVAGAEAVVTNDTMAAHLGASFNRPTIIIANGVNYFRFTDYERAGIANVSTLYPEAFERRRELEGDFPYGWSDAVSADLASITAARVFTALQRLRHGVS